MKNRILKNLGLFISVNLTIGLAFVSAQALTVGEHPVELRMAAVSNNMVHISVLQIGKDGFVYDIPKSSVVVAEDEADMFIKLREIPADKINVGQWHIQVQENPLRLRIEKASGRLIQKLTFHPGQTTFLLDEGPVLGLGEGAKQFDRRNAYYPMRTGWGEWEIEIYGSCLPVPYLIGTSGWAMFINYPVGQFGLQGQVGRFVSNAENVLTSTDIYIIDAEVPVVAMGEYARLTGKAVLPPKWTMGYMQSHRTLEGPEQVISVAKTFRNKKLPCDALIYLGTGFCPSGWNKKLTSLDFNASAFGTDPRSIIETLHDDNFHVILHSFNPHNYLYGTIPPARGVDYTNESHIAAYWKQHRPVFKLGIDGWWPDGGDRLTIESRLARHRMYYEGALSDRPNVRPFSLHRTGYAGMQRYGGWVWSGDVWAWWQTLAAQVPVGLNFSLSGSPFWGTDIGGFFPTKELTGELYLRWFQFGTFCPLFRSHGRAWHLRLPWGWSTGKMGPAELDNFGGVEEPDPEELYNPEVEPICRKYLNLRYRLLPYNYSLAREAHDLGMPMMRALWLHYPNDEEAVKQADEYLWGRDILVAPVVEKGAGERRLYLPAGDWYDWWTGKKVQGKKYITREVDLATMPIYVRAGAIIPLDPVRQYTDEPVREHTTIHVYKGANGEFSLYDDDGKTLDYIDNMFSMIHFRWDEMNRTLMISPDDRMTGPVMEKRKFNIVLVPGNVRKEFTYEGKAIELKF